VRSYGTDLEIRGCTFEDGSCPLGGSVYVRETTALLEGNLHVGGEAEEGGVLSAEAARVTLRRETVVETVSPGGSVVHLQTGSKARLDHCLLARLEGSLGHCEGDARLDAGCTLVWEVVPAGAAAGPRAGVAHPVDPRGGPDPRPDPTECLREADFIHADPLFCGPGDWRVAADSPAAPGGTPGCGRIGAFDPGCRAAAPLAVRKTSWGRLKALYRASGGG
jgi:hypothetical protein